MAFSGEKLRQIRLRQGLTQRDMPVAHDTVSAIESGKRRPHPSTLRKLAETLNVEVQDFFEEAADPKGGDLPDLRKPIDLERYEGSLLELKDALDTERERLRPTYTSTEAFLNLTPEEAQQNHDFWVVLDNSLAVRDVLLRDRGLVK
jgi:transcriptional regulator with XRE-family HTH domain